MRQVETFAAEHLLSHHETKVGQFGARLHLSLSQLGMLLKLHQLDLEEL